MNKYSVDRIEGSTAVLTNGGLTMNVPLSSLPDGVREGDILILNKNGVYETDGEQTRRIKSENATRQDELFQGETYEIKKGLDYKTLLNEAQQTFFRSTNAELKHLVPECVLLALGILCMLTITLVDWQRYRESIMHHDISSYLTTLVAVFVTVIGAFAVILAVITIFRTFKKLRSHVITYKGNLRRMQDKLMSNNIFTEISPEVESKYDNVFTQISESLKNREKNT